MHGFPYFIQLVAKHVDEDTARTASYSLPPERPFTSAADALSCHVLATWPGEVGSLEEAGRRSQPCRARVLVPQLTASR